MDEIQRKWYEIVFDNWEQIFFILGSLGFLLTAIINWFYKKKEIKFAKLHETKVIEIKDFFRSYLKYEHEVKNFFYQTEFGQHYEKTFQTINIEISDAHFDLEYHFRIIKLFLGKNQIELIEELNKKIKEMRSSIAKWHVNKIETTGNKYNDKLTEIGEKHLPNELPMLLKKIEDKLRKNFH